MAGGAIDLGNVRAAGMPTLRLTCEKCGRDQTYSVAELLTLYGKDKGLPDLAVALSAQCGRRESRDMYDQCGFRFRGLGKIS